MSDQPNRMLEFLTNPLRPIGDASRGNRRLPCRSPIALSWPTPNGVQTIRGRLRDISRAGAGLLAASSPPLTRQARIRLTEGEGTPWLEVEIIGVEVERYKRVRIRLRFLEPCPSFILRTAVLGPEARDADDEPTPQTQGAAAWSPWLVESEGESSIGTDRWAC